MHNEDINVSGAYGSGAYVSHGSFTAGSTFPDNQRIEVVELNWPGLAIRVRADLQAAVLTVAGKWITASHIEQIALNAYADGKKDGEESMRENFRKMLGL